MRTIDARPVRFGELAGPLVHGGRFFDWQLISTQAIAAAFDYSFQEIVAAGGIPFAPVVVSTSIERYPTFEDAIAVETAPRRVGESSVELVYEIEDGDGETLASARMTHVTIGPDGGALSLPGETRRALTGAMVADDPAVGPSEARRAEGDATESAAYPTFSASVPVRSPHIERSALAYFEEYPRFADVALEEFLVEHGTSLGELSGEKQPFRLRDWRWEFSSPVPFESVLDVECEIRGLTEETVRVAHTFSTDGETRIEGVSEYGCFDRSGTPVSFDAAALAFFEK